MTGPTFTQAKPHARQKKTPILEETVAKIGLKINRKKTKVMKIHTNATDPIKLDGGNIEELEEFTYLGSKVTP